MSNCCSYLQCPAQLYALRICRYYCLPRAAAPPSEGPIVQSCLLQQPPPPLGQPPMGHVLPSPPPAAAVAAAAPVTSSVDSVGEAPVVTKTETCPLPPPPESLLAEVLRQRSEDCLVAPNLHFAKQVIHPTALLCHCNGCLPTFSV